LSQEPLSGAVTSVNRLESPFSYSDWMLPGPHGTQRVQPNVILAVLSLAALTYAILSSAVIPALPTIQHSLHASETGITWLLTGFLLSASVQHGDHRQALRRRGPALSRNAGRGADLEGARHGPG
jgi:hypothetical protein